MALELPLVPARMVNEFSYCPRLFYLLWVNGDWRDNEHTVEGARVHERVDEERGRLPVPTDIEVHDRFVARGLLLSSDRLGLIARMDIVEGEDGCIRPVDYKKGSPGPRGPWEPELVQLCVQGLILRDNGYRCEDGVLYYAATRTRHVVPFDETLVRRTLELVAALRAAAADPVPPPPLVDSPKCPTCVLVGVCLPDETNLLRDVQLTEVRRLVPARDDAGPLYVVEQGAFIGKDGERVLVRRREGEPEYVRLIDISHVSIYGNVQVSAQAVRALAEEEIPIFHHTYGGWLAAVTTGLPHRNVELRSRQYRLADDAQASLRLSRAIVAAKIRNQRVLLRRNARHDAGRAVEELRRLAAAAMRATSGELLLGIEGLAARTYFGSFGPLLRKSLGFQFDSRNRRPPTDPVNAMLSFLYSLLVKECVAALLSVGLDPYRGLYHRLRFGRPSLALDLAEEFRPLVADSVVLSLVNNRMIHEGDFVRRGPACALTTAGRRVVIEAFEARLDTLVRHPVFRYTVSYRRVLGLQARLLAHWVAGELPRYRAFTTR